MNARTLQALLTRHANRFGPQRIYVLSYTEDGLELGIVEPDESKQRVEIHMGERIELADGIWRVEMIYPGVEIPAKGEVSSARPTPIALLELVGEVPVVKPKTTRTRRSATAETEE